MAEMKDVVGSLLGRWAVPTLKVVQIVRIRFFASYFFLLPFSFPRTTAVGLREFVPYGSFGQDRDSCKRICAICLPIHSHFNNKMLAI